MSVTQMRGQDSVVSDDSSIYYGHSDEVKRDYEDAREHYFMRWWWSSEVPTFAANVQKQNLIFAVESAFPSLRITSKL